MLAKLDMQKNILRLTSAGATSRRQIYIYISIPFYVDNVPYVYFAFSVCFYLLFRVFFLPKMQFVCLKD